MDIDLSAAKPIHYATFVSEARARCPSQIAVRNLSATVNAGYDAWGRTKPQPALISTKLHLSQSFKSAASADNLDSSTVHYGTLSKNIRAKVVDTAQNTWLSPLQLLQCIEKEIKRTAGATNISSLEVDVCFPKASLLGDGAGCTYCISYEQSRTCIIIYLKNVRIPCLIGLNSNERQAKQPVVLSVWAEYPYQTSQAMDDDYTRLEKVLYDTVSTSEFGTLEALATLTLDKLVDAFYGPHKANPAPRNVAMRLLVEKPLAVPYADAPAVEVVRWVG